MKRTSLSILYLSLVLLLSGAAVQAELNVVTTTTDLADIAKKIGGNKVKTIALAKGYQDPHFVDAKPSTILKLKRADVFIQVGLDLEIGWVPSLLEAARNQKIYFGGSGYINASQNIELLEIPKEDPAYMRALGDIHAYGNPHYWLDPQNGKIIATTICNRFKKLEPENSQFFQDNLDAFINRLDAAIVGWKEKLAPYKGRKIIAYHNSWPYFAAFSNIEIEGFIEVKPGIPPTARHLISLIKTGKSKSIKTVIISPYFDERPAEVVAEKIGAQAVAIAPSVASIEGIDSYIGLFDYNVKVLINSFK